MLQDMLFKYIAARLEDCQGCVFVCIGEKPLSLIFPPPVCSSTPVTFVSQIGLLVACYQGFVDVVIALSQCPYLDVNWQDSEGNTALITAAQAGHITITNYLLNYYSGLDIERRNCHGFTALMKASMQGRVECVRSLMMA
ncbi:Ankyrin repeat domain-containing protein 33B, partial [Characodon lateralis]|nr:Ankyrin repeat domain-containing protein 33B [Characodon lateralis]